MQIVTECFYCGHKEKINVYSKAAVQDRRCEKCKDKRKIIKQIETKDVFGYNETTSKEKSSDDDIYPFF